MWKSYIKLGQLCDRLFFRSLYGQGDYTCGFLRTKLFWQKGKEIGEKMRERKMWVSCFKHRGQPSSDPKKVMLTRFYPGGSIVIYDDNLFGFWNA
mgnify:CR=1 FL=1